MNFFRRVLFLFLGLLALCGLYANDSLAAADVTAVRLGLHTDKTRFVVELSEKPIYNIFYLPNPYRIVIDMQEVNWKALKVGSRKTGVIENYRYGLFRKGTSRLVLDLNAPVKIIRQTILPPSEGKPFRFFIDVQKTNNDTFQALVKATRKTKLAFAPPVVHIVPEDKKSKKLRIVIDAGHGGIDPGATGRSGVYEKQLTLQVAKKLRAQLNKNPKYKILLTRQDDTFLSLRERVGIARKYNADLFISIHADSIARSDISGSTVYTLSENASDDEAAALASAHNMSDVIAGVDLESQDDTVQGILIDLAQRETMNFSVKFAKLLIPEIARSGMKVVGKSHRFAGFRVLKAPDVPSVLVELGYLSNRHDEKILKSSKGQSKLAFSISKAVDKYFGNR
ncbi:MAG: N-acetylmuramoyl-L-alanine amidase [Sneathiella sp.]|nr:N-acetylmuramoyl-L-alanine amidase [Sneathiella sp.]